MIFLFFFISYYVLMFLCLKKHVLVPLSKNHVLLSTILDSAGTQNRGKPLSP